MATLSSNLSDDAIGRARRLVASSAGSGPGSGSPVGANSGNHTSSCCSNSTATLMPICTTSGAHPTTFVVSRTRSSSSSATIAMTYGGLIAGSHWWTFTVYPTTVARPDTSTTSISVEWQYGQTGVGGKSNAPHGMLRCTRNTPSLPAVQKNSFSGVSSGRGRDGTARPGSARRTWRSSPKSGGRTLAVWPRAPRPRHGGAVRATSRCGAWRRDP